MSGAPHRPEDETVAYHGEVWTNAGGYATVELPPDAALLPPLAYDLRDLDPPSTAHITSELGNGRFTIATEQPHVKVGWRITGRRPADESNRGDGSGSSDQRRV